MSTFLKRTIKSTAGFFFYHFFSRYNQPAGNRILLYHAVGTSLAHDSYGISISLPLFKEHAKYIKEHHRFAPLNNQYDGGLTTPSLSISFDDGYEDNLRAADILSAIGIPFSLYITTDYIGSKGFLQEEQIRSLASNALCTIGVHGKTHARLGGLSFNKQYNELKTSKERMEDILSTPVESMSYPHGSFTRQTKMLAKQIGFNLCGSSIIGINCVKTLDRYALKRTEIVGSDNLTSLKKKIEGHYDFISLFRK